MKYPQVSFNAPHFLEDTPEKSDQWFAGEELAKAIAERLKAEDGIELEPWADVIAEDWGWCICLRSEGIRFFLGIGEDWEKKEKHWRVFIAKDFDLPLKLFKKQKLRDALHHLQEALSTCLKSIESAKDFEWFHMCKDT